MRKLFRRIPFLIPPPHPVQTCVGDSEIPYAKHRQMLTHLYMFTHVCAGL